MVHLVARAREGTRLFATHAEAAALFGMLARVFPAAAAVCLMPNHVHVVAPETDAARLGDVARAYARWRNARRGERGPVWAAPTAPEALPDRQHLRRTIRYVHLNPCRARLVGDPLAWPWSTHRDAVGFAVPPVRAREHEPARFHRWVSSDPTVAVAGTELPEGAPGMVRWDEVREAVAGVCRVPAEALGRRGSARTLAVQAAWVAGLQDVNFLSDAVAIARSGVYRIVADAPARSLVHRDPALHACVRAIGDDRFWALPAGDLRCGVGWERYRHLR